ncbi:MAG: T9SS type A sorting domain-containing protein, partial [Bacteroidia bacterium]|nr:T9SS type A sorting domain-containing protein [Bacteroidia bacterium]
WIYPNPANDVITIETRGITDGHLYVANALGETVVIDARSKHAHTIDISNLSAGVYFIRIENAHGTTMGKFIKH